MTIINKASNMGYVYCLSNKYFAKNLYKVGFTRKIPTDRATELYKTGVPFPFKVELYKKTKDYKQILIYS